MHVIFLHGPAAAGKHTIGSLLSAATGLPLFHNHLAVDVAKTLFDFGSPSFNRLRATVWLTAFSEAAASGRSFIFTFHPEASVEPALVADLVRAVESCNGRVWFVELVCSRESILARLGAASRRQFGKLTDPVLYGDIERQGGFDFPALPPPLIAIDTDAIGPQQAADSIAAAVTLAEADR